MDEKYLKDLYGWITQKDASFSKDIPYDSFVKKIQDPAYAQKMHGWIGSMDKTFVNDVPLESFIGKTKLSTISQPTATQPAAAQPAATQPMGEQPAVEAKKKATALPVGVGSLESLSPEPEITKFGQGQQAMKPYVAPKNPILNITKQQEEQEKKTAEETGEKEETGYWSNLFNSFVSGVNELDKMVFGLPETAYNILAIPQNAIAYATGLDIATNADLFKKQMGISNPILDRLKKEGDELKQKSQNFDLKNYESSSIYENIGKGNYGDAFKVLTNNIVQSAPVSIAMMMGGATLSAAELAAAGTVGFYGQNREELGKDNPNMPEIEKTIKSLAMAASETVFESVGTGTIGQVYRDIIKKEGAEAGTQIFKEGVNEMYKNALKKYGVPIGLIGEGTEEAATQITQNVISNKPAFEGVADAFITGAGSGVAFSAPITAINAKNKVKEIVQTQQSKNQINNILKNTDVEVIDQLYNVPKNTPITPEQLEIANVNNSRNILLKSLNKQVKDGTITDDDAKQSVYVFDKIQQVSNSVKDLKVTNTEKAEIANLLSKRNQLTTEIQNKDDVLVVNEKQEIADINKQIQNIILSSKAEQDAIQKQAANESLLRTGQPQMGLQEMGEGNAQPQGTPTGTQEAITTPSTEEVVSLKTQETIPTDLQERGEPIASTLEAERRRSNGERIFAITEQDETPIEVTSIEMLRNYTSDQLVAYKPKTVQEEANEFEKLLGEVKTGQKTIKNKQLFNNVVRSIQTVFPKLKVNSFKSAKEMKEFALKQFGEEVTQTLFGGEGGIIIFDENKKPAAILINEEKADNTTMPHEAWHAILFKAFGDNEKLFQEFRDAITATLQKNGFDNIVSELNDFINQEEYIQSDVQAQEWLVQLGGLLASSDIDPKKLNPKEKTLLEEIKAIINDFSNRIIGRPVFLDDATPQDVLDFMISISQSMSKGEDISSFFKEGKEAGPISTTQQSVKKQIIGTNANLSATVQRNLEKAEELESIGKTPKEVRLATGWERGKGGRWRYEIIPGKLKEIDVNDLPLETDEKGVEYRKAKLSDIFIAPELYDAYNQANKSLIDGDKTILLNYPKLADVEVRFKKLNPGSWGSYSPSKDIITINEELFKKAPKEAELTLLHEIQHYIQKVEAFEPGANDVTAGVYVKHLKQMFKSQVESVKDRYDFVKQYYPDDKNLLKQAKDKLTEARKLYKDFKQKAEFKGDKYGMAWASKLYDYYYRVAGEVEARNVEARRNLSPELRRSMLLTQTEKVDREDQFLFSEQKPKEKFTAKKQITEQPTEVTTTPVTPTEVKTTEAGSVGVRGDDFTAKGGNKAVDEKGEPINVFTGTNANNIKDIDALFFENDKTLKEKLSDLAPNYQIFFTDNKNEAESFGKNVLEANVLIKNPIKNKADLSKTKSQLLKEGYDGYIWKSEDGRTHYIVFDKSQIKEIKTTEVEAAKELDLTEKETGDVLVSTVVNPEKFKVRKSLPKFKPHDTKWEIGKGVDIEMSVPETKTTVYDALQKSGGAVVVTNSDATGLGKTKNGTLLQGGIGYTFIAKNILQKIGFAASMDSKIPQFFKAIKDAAAKRDAENPEMKGKPVAVFVMVQTPPAMFGNTYGAEYFGRALNKIAASGEFDIEQMKKELISFIDNYKVSNETGRKYANSLDALKKLITDTDFTKKSSIQKIVDLLITNREDEKSAKFGFDIRRNFLERFFLGEGTLAKQSTIENKKTGEKVTTPTAAFELRKKIKQLGYGISEFVKEHADKNVLSVLEGKTTTAKMNDGNFALTGFYVDPYQSEEDFVKNSKSGDYQHKMFNSKFAGEDAFILDGKVYVDELVPEAKFWSQKKQKFIPVSVSAAGSLYPRTQKNFIDVVERGKKFTVENNAAGLQKVLKVKAQRVNANPLEEIIKTGLANGFSDLAIAEVLSRRGFSNSEIQEGLAKIKQAAPKVAVTEEFAAGYDTLMKKIDSLITQSAVRKDVIEFLKKSKVYQNATAIQREKMLRDVRAKLGMAQKSAPSAKKILGTINDFANITMNEKDFIKKQFQAFSRGVKFARTMSKQVVAEIKELASSGKITPKQAAVILNKFSSINLFSENAVNKFVDYMTKVFSDAEYAEKIDNATRMLSTAKKNIRTKIGISEGLAPILDTMFSIKPALIPDAVLDKYLSLVSMFGQKQAVLTLDEINSVTNDANKVLDAVNEEVSLAEELADRFESYPDKVFDDNGKLDYAATLKQMVKDLTITEEEADIMRKYKSKIVEPIAKEKMTEEEMEEEKNELINFILDQSIDSSTLPTKDEIDLAKKLQSLLGEGLKGLNNTELKNILKVISNINNGYLPHYAQLMVEKLTAINNASVLTKAVDNAKLLPLTGLYSRVKNLITKKGAILEAIRRGPLFNIDQLFGDFKTKDIFNSVFNKAAEGQAKFKSELGKVYKLLEKAENAVASSFSQNSNKILESKFKMMTYLVQLEYESNPDSKQVNPASKYLEATIKHIDEGKSEFGERDANALQKILDDYGTADEGNIDLNKLYNSFNDAEKNAIKTIREVNESLKDKAVYTAAIIRGDKINPLTNYVHLNVLNEVSPIDVTSGVAFVNDYNNSLRPSTKAKSLIERTGKVSPLNFDVFASAERGAKFVLMDYNLTEPIRTARKTINQTISNMEKEGRIPKEKREIINAINKSFEEAIENLLTNAFVESSFADDVVNEVNKQGYRAVLAGTGRFVAELTSNIGFALITDPKAFTQGLKYNGISMSSDGVNVLNNVNSKQTERVYHGDTLSGKMIDTNILSQASGRKNSRSKNAVANKIQQIWNLSGKKYKNTVELIADTLISTPDKMVMRPIWFGSFANEFKKQTGQDVDFKKIADNDEAYMSKFAEAIEQAKTIADERSVLTGASDNAFMGILKGTAKPNQTVMLRAFNNFNNFMSRFMIYEYTTARTGVMASIGNGSLTKKQGASILAGVTTRMIVYTLLSQALAGGLIGLVAGGDDDEEDDKSFMQKFGQALASAFTSMFLGRDFGNAAKTIVNYGVERVNENFLDFLREGEYDPYKDAIQFSVIPPEKKGPQPSMADYIANMGGAFGPSMKTANFILKKATEPEKKKQEAIERREKEVNIRIPLEVLGNLGFVPLYKDVKKVVNKNIYNGLDKALKQSDDKKVADKEMLQGYKNKSDMKRYDPELYESTFGEGAPGYEAEKAKKELKKEKDKLEKEMKDELYDYIPRKGRKSSGSFGASEFGGQKSSGSKSSGFGSGIPK